MLLLLYVFGCPAPEADCLVVQTCEDGSKCSSCAWDDDDDPADAWYECDDGWDRQFTGEDAAQDLVCHCTPSVCASAPY